MATFKEVVRTKRADGMYVVYIRVTHNRKIDYIKTDMYVHDGHLKGGEITDQIVRAKCSIRIKEYLDKLNLQETEKWTVKEVVDFVISDKEQIPFISYCEKFIANLRNKEKNRTADGYEDALRSFRKFFGESIAFQELTSGKINKWIDSLMHTARAKQKYPVNIQTIFKEGEREFNDYDRNIMKIVNRPFVNVNIPKANITQKKAVETDFIRTLLSVTPESKRAYLGHDIAKMIIYLVGINTVDLFYMEKTNRRSGKQTYRNGKLCYNRHKTESTRDDNAYIEIAVRPEILALVEKYKDNSDSKYLFCFKSMYSNEKEFNRAVNKGMKRLCEIAGIEEIKTVGLRHTWATIAKKICNSDELVGFCMNHASAHRTTRIYINADYSPIDELNNQVLDAIFNPKMDGGKVKEVCKNKEGEKSVIKEDAA